MDNIGHLKITILEQSDMEIKTIKDLKRGDYFRIADTANAPIWVRCDYNRSTKKYECYRYTDINHFAEFKGNKKVYEV